jgi:uncharacterized caspase-like protein
MAEKRSALIVATSEYEDARLSPLGGPGEDAEALERVLGNAEIGGFDVQLSLNDQHDVLRTTLEGFFADRGRDDLLLVHFSGHGLKDDDGQLYLAAADTRIDRLMSTGIEAGWVNRLMSRCRSEKIALFLDCCFGGAFTTGLARRAGVDTAGAKETFTGTGRFVITASDAMQYSFESGQLVDDASPQPSPFTGALVEGLKSGEADRNEDGFVSINELFDYLEDRVRQLSPAQTPTKSAFNQVGDWVIAQSTRAPTIRILPASLQAQLKSEDALDRFAALIDLRDLIGGSDPRVADAAMKALEKLTGDDSRRVAAAAARLFGDVPAGRSTANVPSTPLSESSLPDVIKDALASPPASPITAVPPPATPASAAPAAQAANSPLAAAEPPPAVVPPPDQPGHVKPTLAAAAPRRAPPADPVPIAPAPVAAAAQAPSMPSAAPVAPGALWGQPVAPHPAPASRNQGLWAPGAGPAPASAPSSKAPAGPWSFARSFGRAGIGTAIGLLASYGYYLSTDPFASFNFDQAVSMTIVIAGIAAAAILVVEKLVGALRVPNGAAYRIVGHNRWIVSAALGLVVGLIMMVGIAPDELIYAAFFVFGFVVAEAIVGRRPAPTKAAA